MILETLLSPGDVARVLQIPVARASRLVRDGVIPRIEVDGTDLRVTRQDLARFIDSRRVPPLPPSRP